MERPTISGRTSWQFAGLFTSSMSSDTSVGLFSLLMSTIRAIGNNGTPAAHADCQPAPVMPPLPPSSTWMMYGLPLILAGIVCCETLPSLYRKVLINLICAFGLRACTWLVSSTAKPLFAGVDGSYAVGMPITATYARLPSSLSESPWLLIPVNGDSAVAMSKDAISFGLVGLDMSIA